MTDLSAMLRGATGDGVHWALDGPGELNVSLVHLDAGHAIGEHVNDEVDVVVVALAGEGTLTVDGAPTPLTTHVVSCVPRGARRSIAAASGGSGLDYLSIHRRRGPLTIGPPAADEGGDPACWAHLADEDGGTPTGY
jgi:quercetin dioxygenase-like cupin family protein